MFVGVYRCFANNVQKNVKVKDNNWNLIKVKIKVYHRKFYRFHFVYIDNMNNIKNRKSEKKPNEVSQLTDECLIEKNITEREVVSTVFIMFIVFFF